MKSLQTYFRFGGRLGRSAFFLRFVLILASFALADAVLTPQLGTATTWLLNPLALWALVCACVQRLHDCCLSGLWLWLALLPVVGAVWLLWQMARKGVMCDNADAGNFGSDASDFLAVM